MKIATLDTNDESAWSYLHRDAKVALGDGQDYLPGSRDFVRLNFATDTAVLERILSQIADSLQSRRSSK
jgi:bifunctional pyridoxal-dependent enzyme with beta-cystathionase and maltose regulon repressor activities